MNIYKELNLQTPEEVIDYINSGNDVHIQNSKSMTLLQLGVFSNNLEILKALLKQDINIDHKDYYGNTALGCAVKENNQELVKLLLQHGAKIERTTIDGQPLLQYLQKSEAYQNLYVIIQEENGVFQKRQGSREVAQGDKSKEARSESTKAHRHSEMKTDLPDVNSPKNSQAKVAASQKVEEKDQSVFKDDPIIKRQARKEPDFDIFETIELGENGPVLRYLKQGGSMDLTIDKKTNLLQHACFYNNYFIAQILVDRGIDVNYMDQIQFTALSYAVMGGYAPLVKLLLSKGANVQISKIAGESVLEYAQSTNKEIYQLLQDPQSGISQESKNYPDQKPDQEYFDDTYQQEPQFKPVYDIEPYTIEPPTENDIFSLIDQSDLEGVRDYYQQYGTEQPIVNQFDQTPLIYAILTDRGFIVPTLIRSAINLQHVDQDGCNALGCAIHLHQLRTIQNLTRAGAQLDSAIYQNELQSLGPETSRYYVTDQLTEQYVSNVLETIRNEDAQRNYGRGRSKVLPMRKRISQDRGVYGPPARDVGTYKRPKFMNGMRKGSSRIGKGQMMSYRYNSPSQGTMSM